MADSLDILITAYRIKDTPFNPGWKGEDAIRYVRGAFRSPIAIQAGRSVGRPLRDPPMPHDPKRFDAQILLGYHAGLSRQQIAARAGCDEFHVIRRIAYHNS